MRLRMRLIMEIEYTGAEEEDDPSIRDHLATFVHSSTASGMLTNDEMDASQIAVSKIGVACQRLEDGQEPEPVPEASCPGCHEPIEKGCDEDCPEGG